MRPYVNRAVGVAAGAHAPLGVRAFEDNMLNLPLDGSGDERGSEECRRYWHDLQMPRWRAQAIADVRAEWAAGRLPLHYETYLKLLEAFLGCGFLDELVDGMGDEGETVEQVGGPSACCYLPYPCAPPRD